ncbi:hypothetical protein TRFO_04159 [Tritrichomonas foetus]|uniref:TOG domain-containing protein n=1 Tax=Tritrichomonas foetus TaxID=1144522 RepID=A0A1J4KH32_9EUKA|nr:hypothetical protein TRFO_04159 [Tritrichomonas foetus]|eukprot:OHT10657.1 hypothetical protein TRFO_04159 [Tritrichomonas foetus]
MSFSPTKGSFQVSELAFGFLASSVIEKLESENYQIRQNAISDLISTIQTTASNRIEVDPFVDYILKFTNDENIIVAESCCQVIESLCANLRGNVALYKSHFLKIAINHLGSKRKFLSAFAKNILHIMVKSISPQTVISDVFTQTLMAPPRTISDVFNFVSSEITYGTIQPSMMTKFAFIFEDSINSDDNNLVESVQNCLQVIKSNDKNSFLTIAHRMNISNNSSHNMPHNTSNNMPNYMPNDMSNVSNKNSGANYYFYDEYNDPNEFSYSYQQSSVTSRSLDKMKGNLAQTSSKSLNFTSKNSSFIPAINYKRPILSTNNKNTANMVLGLNINRVAKSKSIFSSPEIDEIEIITSKPGSADDSRVPTARVTIGDTDDLKFPTDSLFGDENEEHNFNDANKIKSGIEIVDDIFDEDLYYQKSKSSRKKNRLLIDNSEKAKVVHHLNDQMKSNRRAKTPKSPDEKFLSILEKIRSFDIDQQNEAISKLFSNIEKFIPQITSHLRDVCSSLLDISEESHDALKCFQQLIKCQDINLSPLADFIAHHLLKLISYDLKDKQISRLADDCFSFLITSIHTQKALDVLFNESKSKNDKQRATCASGFGLVAQSITLYTQPLEALAELVVDESDEVKENAKKSVNLIAENCADFTKIVLNFVPDHKAQNNLITVVNNE